METRCRISVMRSMLSQGSAAGRDRLAISRRIFGSAHTRKGVPALPSNFPLQALMKPVGDHTVRVRQHPLGPGAQLGGEEDPTPTHPGGLLKVQAPAESV